MKMQRHPHRKTAQNLFGTVSVIIKNLTNNGNPHHHSQDEPQAENGPSYEIEVAKTVGHRILEDHSSAFFQMTAAFTIFT